MAQEQKQQSYREADNEKLNKRTPNTSILRRVLGTFRYAVAKT